MSTARPRSAARRKPGPKQRIRGGYRTMHVDGETYGLIARIARHPEHKGTPSLVGVLRAAISEHARRLYGVAP